MEERSEEAMDELGAAVSRMWLVVLDLDEAALDDDFFALGGNSLGAVELTMAILEELEVEIDVGVLFTQGTLRELIAECRRLVAS